MRGDVLMGESAPWGAMACSLRQVLRRGTAELLERDERGVFLYDILSGAYMLSAPVEAGRAWLSRHEDRGYRLMLMGSRGLCDWAEARYGMTHRMDCVQAWYPHGSPPALEDDLTLRTAREEDYPLLRANYDKVGEDELLLLIRQKRILLGLEDGVPAGFVGEHLEGSIGLLHILPAFRGKGYARTLEGAMIARALARGQEAYCQVDGENAASLALQRSLGMALLPGSVHWLWREE